MSRRPPQVSFGAVLGEVQRLSRTYNMLDVKATRWFDDFNTFKNGVRDLEVMLMNLMQLALDSAANITVRRTGAWLSLPAFFGIPSGCGMQCLLLCGKVILMFQLHPGLEITLRYTRISGITEIQTVKLRGSSRNLIAPSYASNDARHSRLARPPQVRLELLEAFQIMAKVNEVKRFVKRATSEWFALFKGEINTVKNLFDQLKRTQVKSPELPRYAGLAKGAQNLMKRLEQTTTVLAKGGRRVACFAISFKLNMIVTARREHSRTMRNLSQPALACAPLASMPSFWPMLFSTRLLILRSLPFCF